MIEVENVSRHYGSFRAVDGISFSVEKGEIVGLLGPNGAGKSTTMRMITGYLPPTAGTIKIGGETFESNALSLKKKIGYMPESAPLYGDMIVADYLCWVTEIHGDGAHEKVSAMASLCGLTDVMHKNISDLSRGYRQRVGLAHALIHDPEILILDEPTSGLDPNQIVGVRALIREIGKTRTVIVSTHILSEVEAICDRVIIISEGKIVADSPTAELAKRHGSALSVRLQVSGCDTREFASALSALPGVARVEPAEATGVVIVTSSGSTDPRPDIFTLVCARGWILLEMTPVRNSLEDVFRSLTTTGDES